MPPGTVQLASDSPVAGRSFSARRARACRAVAAIVAGCLMIGMVGCSNVVPPPPRPQLEIESVERGVIVTVRDRKVDASTAYGVPMAVRSPPVGIGPVAVSVPMPMGGRTRGEYDAEELTIKVDGGKMFQVIQARADPPFAVGERVKVLHERENLMSGVARTVVERDDDPSPPPRRP